MDLIIHAGMPKTGTTSLQLRLSASAPTLLSAGVDYPLSFRDSEGIAHHKLGNALSAADDICAAAVKEFTEYMTASNANRIVISSESITNALTGRSTFRSMKILKEINEIRRVRLVIILRSIESFIESMYLHSIKVGETQLSATQYVEGRYRWSRSFFGSLAALRALAIVPVVRLLKFAPSPQYDDQLVDELQIGDKLRATLTSAQRVNERLSWKAQTILLHLPLVQEKLGKTLPRGPLIQALTRKLEFPDDLTSYSTLSESQEGYLREGALAAAYEVGLREYPYFFGEFTRSVKPRVQLDLQALSPADFEILRAWADQPTTS